MEKIMKKGQHLALTFSGVRSGEERSIEELIAGCGLSTEDISARKLRHFVVARKGAKIVGVVGLELAGNAALLRSLAVSEAFRNQGIAKMLMDSIERYALSQGVDTLYLLTLTAEGFFIKQGYDVTNRDRVPEGVKSFSEFEHICPESAVCMHKRISL